MSMWATICGADYLKTTPPSKQAHIKKGFLLHSVLRHVFNHHPGIVDPIKIIPIDFIPAHFSDRFSKLRNKEMFWIYKLQILTPNGLNNITELVTEHNITLAHTWDDIPYINIIIF